MTGPSTHDLAAVAAPTSSSPAATPPRGPRRTVLKVVGVIAVGTGGVAAVTACAPDDSTAAPGSSEPPQSSSPSSSAPSSSGPAGSASSSDAVPDGVRVKKSDVPEGGGIILTDDDYVVTQPESGTYKAFTKICTHQQCPVTRIESKSIICECHGSRYSIVDGSVTNPPATEALAEAKVEVAGEVVVIVA
jgi:Rieske Fe-S protein